MYTVREHKLEKKLGSGRFSSVWKSSDCVLKIYYYEINHFKYFENECKMLSWLNTVEYNDNLIHMIIADAFVEGVKVHPFIILEDGGASVSTCMKQRNLTEDEVKHIMRGTLGGLHFLHTRGVIHTDIKPSNVLINNKDQVKIADLGTSTFADNLFSMCIGTDGYCAPEVLLEHEYDTSVDIWATCIMCAEMMLHQKLFSACDDDDASSGDLFETVSSTTESDTAVHEEIYKQLLYIDKLIGPPPVCFRNQARFYYNALGHLKNDPDLQRKSLNSYGLSPMVQSFILAGLKYKPKARASAEVLLAHRWLI